MGHFIKEESVTYPFLLPLITISVLFIGLYGVISARCSRCPVKVGRSNWLVLAIICTAGLLCLYAAVVWPRGVLPSGLVISLLLIASLWGSNSTTELDG